MKSILALVLLTFAFIAIGNATSANAQTTVYKYDAYGRLLSASTTNPSNGQITSTAYTTDNIDNRCHLTTTNAAPGTPATGTACPASTTSTTVDPTLVAKLSACATQNPQSPSSACHP